MRTTELSRAGGPADVRRPDAATRTAIAVFGVLAALAGVEHGVGEILQGPVAPAGPVVASWPDSKAFAPLGGEPALIVLPDVRVAGTLAVLVALALGAWAVLRVRRPRDGVVLVGLAVALLLVGGGFGPPLLATVLGLAATRLGRHPGRPPGRVRRALGRAHRQVLVVAVAVWLCLLPGVPVLGLLTDADLGGFVAGLTITAFTGLGLALVAARAHDAGQDLTTVTRLVWTD